MKRRFFRNRKTRYVSVSATLTVVVIVAVILLNTAFGMLATRYEWATYMNAEASYDVTSVCYGLLDDELASVGTDPAKRGDTVQLIFCDTEAVWEEDATQSYLYHTAKSIAERFPGKFALSFCDIFLNPAAVRKYARDPKTGEDMSLEDTDVIVVCGDYYRVYGLNEFFVFSDVERTAVTGYNGERKLTSGILHAINLEPQKAYLTGNHGELMYDTELLYLLDDAGYEIETDFDLAERDVPADCSLLITYNPNSDLDMTAGIAEHERLDRYLERDGVSYLVFVSKGAPLFANFEAYLNEWGVRTVTYTDHTTGKEYRCSVQDTAQSITSDGYTIYGQLSEESGVQTLFGGVGSSVVFKNTTALTHATGYKPTGTGTYERGNRTLYGIYESSDSALLWANGVATGNRDAMLMTLTEQKNETGSSRVCVVASVDCVRRDQLQSAVLDNPDAMQRLFSVMGQTHTTEGLQIKPFSTTDIETITTAQMLRWTICLSVIPAALVAAVGIVVLVRRRA